MSKINKYKELITGKTLKNAKKALVKDKSAAKGISSMYNSIMDSNLDRVKESANYIRKADNKLTKAIGGVNYRESLRDTMTTARHQNRLKRELGASKEKVKSINRKTNIARVGTGVGAAGTLGLGVSGVKKLSQNKREKTAFEIINDAYENI